jgi:PiT family inorganic phosphate transporter
MLNSGAITLPLVIVILLALTFDFINGFHDTANSIATTVSTRALSPRIAIVFAASLNLVGALVSVNVAETISKGIIRGSVEDYVIIATLIAAIIWNLITWFFGIPSSSSHALIGALIGSSLVNSLSMNTVIWSNVFYKVIIWLVASPVIGLVMGFLVMRFLFFVLARLSQYVVNRWFSNLQILSAGLMAFAHGSNDAQKSMGIITLALVSAGVISGNVGIPIEVKIACALAMAAGTSIGGWKIIKTMGINMIKLQPVGGFAAETASAAVILTATAFGAPVSTTHVISSAIMGVGAAKRLSAVRWSLAKSIAWAWIFTIPVSAAIGALITLIIKAFL